MRKKRRRKEEEEADDDEEAGCATCGQGGTAASVLLCIVLGHEAREPETTRVPRRLWSSACGCCWSEYKSSTCSECGNITEFADDVCTNQDRDEDVCKQAGWGGTEVRRRGRVACEGCYLTLSDSTDICTYTGYELPRCDHTRYDECVRLKRLTTASPTFRLRVRRESKGKPLHIVLILARF